MQSVDTETVQLFGLACTMSLNWYRKHSTEWETVATIQDEDVAKLWNNDSV